MPIWQVLCQAKGNFREGVTEAGDSAIAPHDWGSGWKGRAAVGRLAERFDAHRRQCYQILGVELRRSRREAHGAGNANGARQ